MASVRTHLELLHKKLAKAAGPISLMLTKDTLTKRQIKTVCDQVDEIIAERDRLRASAGLSVVEA